MDRLVVGSAPKECAEGDLTTSADLAIDCAELDGGVRATSAIIKIETIFL